MEIQTRKLAILRPRKAAEKMGVGRSTYYKLVAAGEIKQVRLSKRAVGSFEHEIDAWLESRPRAV